MYSSIVPCLLTLHLRYMYLTCSACVVLMSYHVVLSCDSSRFMTSTYDYELNTFNSYYICCTMDMFYLQIVMLWYLTLPVAPLYYKPHSQLQQLRGCLTYCKHHYLTCRNWCLVGPRTDEECQEGYDDCCKRCAKRFSNSAEATYKTR